MVKSSSFSSPRASFVTSSWVLVSHPRDSKIITCVINIMLCKKGRDYNAFLKHLHYSLEFVKESKPMTKKAKYPFA